MIITTPNGRRRSVRTGREDIRSFTEGYALCTPEERALIQALLNEGDSNSAAALSVELNESLYRRPLVPLQQFIEDPYYLGDSMATMYPALKQDLVDLFSAPYREVVLTGSIGSGKTYLASTAICRILYELSCLKNPQLTFGLSPGTEMVIMLISKNLVLAREVMKTSIDDKIKLSPYFMQHFTPRFSTDYTLFPHNIRMTIGSYGAERALGANVFSAFLDECLGKKCLLNIGGHGKSAKFSVGDLWAMGPAGRDGLLVEALDHATGQQTWTPFRMRLSTVQPLVRIEAEANLGSCVRAIEPSREHPLLVRRDEWLIYVPAAEIVVGDELVWRRDDGEEGRDVERGAATEVVGGSEAADRGTQSILGEDAQRGDQGAVGGKRSEAVDWDAPQRGGEGEDRSCPEGAEVLRGDASQDGSSGQGALYARMAGAAGSYHEGACRCRAGSCATAPSGRTGSSEPGTEADGGAAAADARSVPGPAWPRAQRGIAGQDLGRECAGDQGSGALVSVPCVIAGWRIGSMSDGEREASGSTAVHGKRCGAHCRRRSDGVDALRVRWKEKDDDWRLLSDKERWRASISGGERFGTSLSRQGTCALGSRMEVVPGKWALDDPCGERSAHSECMDGTVCDGGVHGERAETSRALSHHVDGRSIGGCRSECLRVSDLSDAYHLVRVTATRDLPAEQTYSIETDCQTFVADGCVVHNTNFPPKRSVQQINQTFGKQLTAANFDIVEKVYRSMVRRIKSRFQTAGGDFPGMVIMVSSAATLDSFTERKLREARKDPTVFVRDHTAWTSKPKDHFCGKWFYVLCSKSSLRSRILEDGECDEISPEYLEENNAWMIEVPVEYREDFESNLEDSLRDIAGVSTQAISAFFQRVDAIDACIDKDRKHPFSSEVWISGSPATFDWDYLCRKIERRLPGGFTETAWAPKEAPSSPRWIHIDTSISGDSTGFALGRIDRWVEVVRRDGDGHAYTDTAPYYIIEVLLSIRPPTGDQIYMPDLRRLVYELQAHGFPIHGFSSDSFQYIEMHQQIRRHGIHTELISMDRTIDPYEELKSAIYEKRIEFYEYTNLLQELRSLEYDRVKGKIDHPRHSSKDLSDALAGTIWGLKQQAARLPWAADADTPRKAVGHDHGWVSDMIPAEDVDLDEVRAARSAQSAHVLMPFFIGDD